MSTKVAERYRRSPAQRRRRARLLVWATGLVLVVGAGIGYLAGNYGWAGVPAVGEPAPRVVVEDSEGRPVDLGDHLGRTPVLLVFYMFYG